MIGVLTGIAWNLKILIAFTSDSFPIFGRRRKPYLCLGVTIQALAWLGLGLLEPSIGGATGLLCTATLGQVMVSWTTSDSPSVRIPFTVP